MPSSLASSLSSLTPGNSSCICFSGYTETLEELASETSPTKNVSDGCFAARRHVPQPSPRTECLLQLIMAQLAVLLQLTQLWTVLGGLTPAVDRAANGTDTAKVADADDQTQGISVVDFSVKPDSVCVLSLRPIVIHCCGMVSTSS